MGQVFGPNRNFRTVLCLFPSNQLKKTWTSTPQHPPHPLPFFGAALSSRISIWGGNFAEESPDIRGIVRGKAQYQGKAPSSRACNVDLMNLQSNTSNMSV